MRITAAQSTDLFTGSPDRPLQVVRVTLAEPGGTPALLRVEGDRITVPQPVEVPPSDGEEVVVEVPIAVDPTGAPGRGDRRGGGARAGWAASSRGGGRRAGLDSIHDSPLPLRPGVVEHPGRLHRDLGQGRLGMFGGGVPGARFGPLSRLTSMARRDPDYAFVLAELDYLKPYWDAYPEDRAYISELLGEGRLELVGGTYNEPNTNLTASETTIRKLVYGVGYQRDVMGGVPATAWQLDAFGHDPQFPGSGRLAGLTSSSWARGPFHAWGPNRMPTTRPRCRPVWSEPEEPPRCPVPQRVPVDRADPGLAADLLHGRPLLVRMVDGQPRRRCRTLNARS